jgi:hypothetical protein
MTDKELFTDMLTRNGIAYTDKYDPFHVREDEDSFDTVVLVKDGMCERVVGYSHFFTLFRFDRVTGALMEVGLYE